MKRLVVTITPAAGAWVVRSSHTKACSAAWPRKADAVAMGRRMARAHHAAGGLAQLRIKARNGRIQTEHTYGADPRRTKG